MDETDVNVYSIEIIILDCSSQITANSIQADYPVDITGIANDYHIIFESSAALYTATGNLCLLETAVITQAGGTCCSSGVVLYDTATGELKVDLENLYDSTAF
jgi:hypothetical protein